MSIEDIFNAGAHTHIKEETYTTLYINLQILSHDAEKNMYKL